MAKTEKLLPHRGLLGLSTLILILTLPTTSPLAASLSTQSNSSGLENFQIIANNFWDGGISIGLDNLSSIALSQATPQDNLKLILDTTPLSPLDGSRDSLSLESVGSSLSRLEFDTKLTKLEENDILVLTQTTYDKVGQGIYYTPSVPKPRPLEQLVGDYLILDSSGISAVNPPKTYFFNQNTVGLSLLQPPTVSLTLPNEMASSSGIALPPLQQGIQLNRVSPETDVTDDSILQLWPRTPFQQEVSETLINISSASFQQTDGYGNLNIDVNLPTMPKNVLLTTLDLQVDWVNSGGYSKNLRDTINEVTEQHRLQQLEFQQRIEASRQQWAQQQRAYQSQVQQQMNQSLNKINESRGRNQPNNYFNRP